MLRYALAPWRFGGNPPMSRLRASLFHRTMRAVDALYPRLPVAAREWLVARVMGRHADEWVRTYDATRPLPDLFHDAEALLATLPPCLVVEVGCGSGAHLAWLAARHPVHRFLGTDRFPTVIAYARRYAAPNCGFEVRHALDVPALAPRVVVAVGALTYVQPEHLAALLAALRPPVDLLVSDPQGTSFRGNFSWSHDYLALLAAWRAQRRLEAGNVRIHAGLSAAGSMTTWPPFSRHA